ncbi:MAG: hypothetical protein AAB373_05400 [Patescibacteria group bacterium]
MFIRDINFEVAFSDYCEKHFCKDFYRKYKGKQWLETKKTIIDTLKRVFMVQQTSLIDVLCYFQEDGVGIFKYDFKVAGTNMSPKTSGNRVIFYLSNKTGKIEILLVYSKDDCSKKGTETQWIFGHIKAAFPEYRKYCK